MDRFKINKPYMISDKKIILYPIEYDKHYFMLQTPKAVMFKKLQGHISQTTKFCKTALLFEQYKFSKLTNNFIQGIRDIENSLLKKCNGVDHNTYIRSLNFTNSNENCYFNMHVQAFDGKLVLPIFDYKKRPREISYVVPGSNCISIIYLKDIWISNNRVGFNWILIQSKVYLPFMYIKRCLISEEVPISLKKAVVKSERGQDLTKYDKMLKFGVPLEVIKMDLKKNGIPYSSFECSGAVGVKDIVSRPVINPLMLKHIKLKKVKKRKKKPIRVLNTDDSRYRPPSSSELKSLLLKLKSCPT